MLYVVLQGYGLTSPQEAFNDPENTPKIVSLWGKHNNIIPKEEGDEDEEDGGRKSVSHLN